MSPNVNATLGPRDITNRVLPSFLFSFQLRLLSFKSFNRRFRGIHTSQFPRGVSRELVYVAAIKRSKNIVIRLAGQWKGKVKPPGK